MRNTLEVMNQILNGKTLRFPVIPAIIRSEGQCNFLTNIAPIGNPAGFPKASPTHSASINHPFSPLHLKNDFSVQVLPEGQTTPANPVKNSRLLSLKNNSSVFYTCSVALGECCINHITNQTIDCIDTPTGKLKGTELQVE